MLQNLFGDIALDATIKSLLQKFGRMSFDNTSSLRIIPTGGTVATVSTVTAVTTMATGNIGFGDNGKNATSIMMSNSVFSGSIGKNFIRS